jgi:hypothetical protein
MKSHSDRATQPLHGGTVDVMTEEQIDQTLKDTFPASDPPPWTLGTDQTPPTTDEKEEEEEEEG